MQIACYHPLKGFPIGKTENGKTKYKIVPYQTDHVEHMHGDVFEVSNVPILSQRADYAVRDFVTVPCGQCVGCRLEYSRQWANRCMLELQYHDSSFFVTLTYDDEHVPRSVYADPETGEAFQSLTLSKRDFQLFMKRLRKAFPDDKIRFFMAGEYGSNTFRPHYHAIIFGLHLSDLRPYKRSEQGFTYYISDSLSRCWSDRSGKSIGYAVVAPVTWETCAYTARYVMKKLNGSAAEFYSSHNIVPEFTLMSRKPGIAKQYFDDHPDLYEFDMINITTPKGGRSFKPPRYFDKLFDLENSDELAEIKAIRQKTAVDAANAKLTKTDLSYLELLAIEEENLKNRARGLLRKEF